MMSNLNLNPVVNSFLGVLYEAGLLLFVRVMERNCCIEILSAIRIHHLIPFCLVFG